MRIVRVFDLAAVCVVFLVTLIISSSSLTWPDLGEVLVLRIKVANLFLFAGYLTLCSAVFSACGLYRSHRLSHWMQRLREMLLAATCATGALLALKLPFSLEFATNDFLLMFWPLSFCTLVLAHEIALRLLHLARLHGRNLRNVIIVGEGPDTRDLANRVRQEAGFGYRVLRIIDAREMAGDGRIAGNS
jgi:FlaA1/EpsC-like NDP-sugar epimerase